MSVKQLVVICLSVSFLTGCLVFLCIQNVQLKKSAFELESSLKKYFENTEIQIESLKKDVKEIQKSTRIWMTGDINQRITSDGRSQLLVEPEQKLTGDNLSESRRKKVNKTGKTELMGFGFQVSNDNKN